MVSTVTIAARFTTTRTSGSSSTEDDTNYDTSMVLATKTATAAERVARTPTVALTVTAKSTFPPLVVWDSSRWPRLDPHVDNMNGRRRFCSTTGPCKCEAQQQAAHCSSAFCRLQWTCRLAQPVRLQQHSKPEELSLAQELVRRAASSDARDGRGGAQVRGKAEMKKFV